MSTEELEELRNVMKEFQQAAERKDVYGMVDKDVEFHDIIFKSTQNEKLIQIVNNLREQIYRFRVAYLRRFNRYKIIQQEHQEILQVIEKNQVEEAERVATIHIQNQEKAVIQLIREEEKETNKKREVE